MSNKSLLLILSMVSLATHFAFFGHPNQTVFDEVHFGKFISGYYTHEYYFDIHPPLGKLMIAGFAKIFNFKPDLPAQAGFSFAQIGEKFPDNKYLALRFLPPLAGALLPIVIFLLALELKFTTRGAFFAGFFIAIENAMLTQTHYILMDGFLLLFGFLALLFYFRRKFLWMAIFGALAASIKWTGLTFLALLFLLEIFQIWRQRGFKQVLKLPLYFLVIPLIIYFSIFSIHFSLLTKPGSGDAFMSANFHNQNIVKKFVELNIQMYQSNQRLTASHPYGSQWYSWPFMARPIYYWVSDHSRIYFIGNPVVWWVSTMAVLISFLYITRHRIIRILLGGYFLNLLPFIGIKRVMFLYHYLASFVFAILILIYLIEKQEHARKIFVGLAIASVVAFIYFAPLTYGLSLSPKAYEAHVWLPSWR